MTRSTVPIAFAVLLLVACSDPTGSGPGPAPELPPSELVTQGLEYSLTVRPDSLGPHDPFEVDVVVRNLREEPVVIWSPSSCWVSQRFIQTQVDTFIWPSPGLGLCFGAVSEWEIPEGGDRRWLRDYSAEDMWLEPVPSGWYIVRARVYAEEGDPRVTLWHPLLVYP